MVLLIISVIYNSILSVAKILLFLVFSRKNKKNFGNNAVFFGLFHAVSLFQLLNTSSVERINKATLFREILPDAERSVEISRKTVYGLVLTFYSRNIPLFNK